MIMDYRALEMPNCPSCGQMVSHVRITFQDTRYNTLSCLNCRDSAHTLWTDDWFRVAKDNILRSQFISREQVSKVEIVWSPRLELKGLKAFIKKQEEISNV